MTVLTRTCTCALLKSRIQFCSAWSCLQYLVLWKPLFCLIYQVALMWLRNIYRLYLLELTYVTRRFSHRSLRGWEYLNFYCCAHDSWMQCCACIRWNMHILVKLFCWGCFVVFVSLYAKLVIPNTVMYGLCFWYVLE